MEGKEKNQVIYEITLVINVPSVTCKASAIGLLSMKYCSYIDLIIYFVQIKGSEGYKLQHYNI